MNLSFAGCGFLGIYHVGVAVCFKKYAPHLLLGKISGASFGALSACCLLCDLPIGEITSDVLRVVREARAGSLGPFSPSFNIQNVLLEVMEKYLPHDAHKIVSGKLHISLTRVYDGKNVIVSEFPTREDLLQALLASCFVPVFSGLLPPRFRGIRYMDGGFSDNLPVLDENTITVSPFCGESDICPRDLSSQLFHVNLSNTSIELSRQNVGRFARILFPPRAEVLSDMCRAGFDDALRYLQRNKMITCARCVSVRSAWRNISTSDCLTCVQHTRDALDDDLPDTVMTIFEEAIATANSGFVSHSVARCVTLCVLPCTLPLDVLRATITNYVADRVEVQSLQYKLYSDVLAHNSHCVRRDSCVTRLWRCTPRLGRGAWRAALAVLQQLHGFAYAAHDRSASASAYSKFAAGERERRDDVVMLRRVLGVTSHEEALLSYCYIDDDERELHVTQIYDVTDADTDVTLTRAERHVNNELQFDAEWSELLPHASHIAERYNDDDAEEDDDDGDSNGDGDGDEDVLCERNIFSDPESEWHTRDSPQCDAAEQPEADQYNNIM